MRRGKVKYNNIVAGYLTETENGHYEFEYQNEYLLDNQLPPISLTLNKQKEIFVSEHLFPFFFNMLSEGANKKMQCRKLKIDEEDYFGLLLKTGNNETIGAVTVEKA